MNSRYLVCLLAAACLFSTVPGPCLAQELQTQAEPETFQSLNLAFKDAMRASQKAAAENSKKLMDDFQAKLDAAATDEEKQAVMDGGMPAMPMFNPMGQPFVAEFSKRFLDYAVSSSGQDDAVDALVAAIGTSNGPDGEAQTWAPALAAFDAHFVTSERIGDLVRTLGQFDDPAAEASLGLVIERNPSRQLQGLAIKTLIASRKNSIARAEMVSESEAARQQIVEAQGAETADKLVADLPRYRTELEGFQNRLRADYNDLFPDLSVGQPAPETISRDLAGGETKLSALKGRVVVLDFWATWCGPCRAMIPHEREMVARLKDKPFSLVSISVDEELETLTDFLAETEMPWSHWWAGDNDALTQKWDIQFFPTIVVIDSQGIIRHKDLRDHELEEAVNELLAEMESVKQ